MRSHKKIYAASLSLLMALSIPVYAFGEGSRPEGLLTEVRTVPDLTTVPGTGSGLDLIPHEWRMTERSLMRPDGSVLLTDAVHHVIWKVKDGMKSVFAGLEIPLGYDATDRPLGAYLDGATGKSFFLQENPTRDRLAGEDHTFNFKVRSEKLDPQTPVKIKVTYTPDKEMSFEGIAYYYGYKDYSSTGNFVNRSVTLDAGGGTPFTLQELSVNPISLRTIWMKPAKYTIIVELIQSGETQKSLGTYTRSFNVISGYPAVTGTHGSDVEQLLKPPAAADPLKLRLQLSLQKLEEGGSAAPGQHFQLYYHGQLVGDGETNGDGIAKLHGQANEGPVGSEEGFRLVWLGVESGEYNMTGQWSMVNGAGEDEEQKNINSPFHYHYSITAPEFRS